MVGLRLERDLMVVASVLLLSAGCQKPEQTTYDDEETSRGIISSGGGGRSSELVTIPVSFQYNGTSLTGFSLADATTFDISLEGCASGYTSTADEGSTALQVYKYDRGCLAKLTGFTFGGRTYTPTAAGDFTTWSQGDTATFDEAGEPGTNAVTVNVVSQLADPISGTEAVVYSFSELIKGADKTILEADVGDGHSLTVASEDPPSFTIKSVTLTGISATGAGEFEIVLECTADIGVTDACEGVDFADITYKLVEDTYGSTLVIGDANALFPADEYSITLPADRVAPGDLSTVNGGFKTVTISGPDEMANHPNMIFIMQAADTSYQYFNIDVSTLTQD